MHLDKGTTLLQGKYIIDSVLGQGGFGITYLASQTNLDRKVAIKEFFIRDYCSREEDTTLMTVSGFSSDIVELYKQKFIKEAKTIAKFENPHIIHIYDVFEENGTAYYVMEYLPFGNLLQRIPENGMNHKDASKYIRQIADALQYVHNHNILHLDVKPSNVMFRSIDEAVLIDFGNAKHFNKDKNGYTTTIRPGISEGYAPLEQYEIEGKSLFTQATDIYALGATLYHLITGNRPPSASNVIKGLPGLDSKIPQQIQCTIEAAMKPVQDDRIRSIELFIQVLDKGITSTNKPNYNARKWTKIIKVIVLCIGLLGITGWFITVNPWHKIDISNVFKKKLSQMDVSAIIERAEKGDAEAQAYLGYCYLLGEKGLAVDSLKSIEWLTKATEQNNMFAQYLLGESYYYGDCGNLDRHKAADLFQKAAEQGFSMAQARLGTCYRLGEGVEQSFEKAIEWYTKAAEQKDAEAQYNLGISYATGEGVIKNYIKAAEWYLKAAEQNHPEAQCNLGYLYAEGKGVEKDIAKATEWFRLAAEQGIPEAQYHYGSQFLFEEGNGYDKEKAMYWLKKAAEQGLADAQYQTGKLLNETVIAHMIKYNDREDEDNQKLIKEVARWYEKAAEQGHAEAQEDLARCYEAGWGVEQDRTKALHWYEKAAGDFNTKLQYKVGLMYLDGISAPVNKAKAIEWWKKAAKFGNADAQFLLGLSYETGSGVQRDYSIAADWYTKAAEQGLKEAQYSIACYYLYGTGVNMNVYQAIEWFKKAAEQGHPESQCNLALQYEKGEHITQDYTKAVEWYRKAAGQGIPEAQYGLGRCYYMGYGVTKDKQTAIEWWEKAAEQGLELAKEALEKCDEN